MPGRSIGPSNSRTDSARAMRNRTARCTSGGRNCRGASAPSLSGIATAAATSSRASGTKTSSGPPFAMLQRTSSFRAGFWPAHRRVRRRDVPSRHQYPADAPYPSAALPARPRCLGRSCSRRVFLLLRTKKNYNSRLAMPHRIGRRRMREAAPIGRVEPAGRPGPDCAARGPPL